MDGTGRPAFVVKAEVRDSHVRTFAFTAQKTMYGGKRITQGDTIFVFASENEGGQGLTARAKRALGRRELKLFTDWKDGQPATELNFKFYRQATTRSPASRRTPRRSSADSFSAQ